MSSWTLLTPASETSSADLPKEFELKGEHEEVAPRRGVEICSEPIDVIGQHGS